MDAFIQDQLITKINVIIEVIKRIRDALKELIMPTEPTPNPPSSTS